MKDIVSNKNIAMEIRNPDPFNQAELKPYTYIIGEHEIKFDNSKYIEQKKELSKKLIEKGYIVTNIYEYDSHAIKKYIICKFDKKYYFKSMSEDDVVIYCDTIYADTWEELKIEKQHNVHGEDTPDWDKIISVEHFPEAYGELISYVDSLQEAKEVQQYVIPECIGESCKKFSPNDYRRSDYDFEYNLYQLGKEKIEIQVENKEITTDESNTNQEVLKGISFIKRFKSRFKK